MKQSSTLRFFLVLALTLLMVAGLSVAQTSKGMIAGNVTDSTGAVIAGATVSAASKDSGDTRTVTTGPTGGFRMDAMVPGNYKITITMKGFQTLTIENVAVAASVITPVDGKLVVGASSTVVNVEAQNNAIQTETGELSHNISTQEIKTLPGSSLNPMILAMTEPGVTDAGGRASANGTSFSVNGLSARSNNFLLDGQDNNDNSIQGQAFQVGNGEAIQEVAVLTNSYGAEFGRGGASVTNMIFKSGTNSFHGSAWETYLGSGLNAIDYQSGLGGVTPDCTYAQANNGDCVQKGRWNEHIYGFSVGGPIKKDKLFFFFSSQWDRFYGKAIPSTIAAPTANGAAVLAGTGSANAALLLKYYGNLRAASGNQSFALGLSPTGVMRPVVDFGDVQRAATNKNNPDTQWNYKVDWMARQSDSFQVRYFHDQSSLSPDFYNFPTSLPGFDTLQGGPSENVGIAWTHTFNTNAVNELRASWGHFDFQFQPTAETLANPLYTAPRLTLSGLSRTPLFGVSTALPQGRGHQTYQVQDALTYTHGSHVFKAGFDVSRMLVMDHIPFNFFGSETFASGGNYIDPTTGLTKSYTMLANFVDDFAGGSGSAAKTFGSPIANPRMLHQAFYLQDTYKVKSNLTLDLGIRYEFQPNPENYLSYPGYNMALGPFANMLTPVRVKEDTNNWGPRIGLAWTPKFAKALFGEDKTVIRAGYGIFYDSFYTNMLDNSQGSAPNSVATGLTSSSSLNGGRGYSNAYAQVALMSPVLNTATAAQTSLASNMTNPQIHQWNLNIQRELPGAMNLTLAYVGTRAEHGFVTDYLNPRMGWDPTQLAAGKLVYLGRYNPSRYTIGVRDNAADSIYHGFNAKLERRFAKGLFFRGAYTFGKVIDNGSDPYAIGDVYSIVPQNAHNRAAERGLAAQNIAHRFVITYDYQVPGLKWNSNGFSKALSYVTKGWELSGQTTAETGVPQSLYISAYDTDGDGYAGNGRPFVGNPAAPATSVAVDGIFIGGTPGTLYDWNTGDVVTAKDVRYVVKPGLGNVGRNSYINPGYWNFNSAVVRHVKLPKWEKQEVQFRMEMMNMFNHPNADNWVSGNVLSSLFLDTNEAKEGGRTIRFRLSYQF